MLRSVTWRLYTGIALFLGADIGAGFWFANNGNVEEWIYRVGLVMLVFSPLVLVAVYTMLRQQWWKNDLGTALVWCCVTYIPIAIPLAWVFVFDGGILTNTWLAWFEVSGPVLSSLSLLRLAYVFARIGRDKKNGTH
jgi:hypothetical protein